MQAGALGYKYGFSKKLCFCSVYPRMCGQRYLDGWVIDYNLFREHESLDYKTPGEVAKVSVPFSEWEDVVEASSPDDRPRVRNLREVRARLRTLKCRS